MSCNSSAEASDSRDPSSSTTLSAVDGDATSLFEHINRDKIWGSNLDPPESAKNVIKPWHQRLTLDPSTQSNVDDQLAITVPFTCPVRLKSILIHTGTGDFAPTRCRAFVNRPDGVDFDEVEAVTSDHHPRHLSPLASNTTLGHVGSGKAQADFALLQGQQGVVEYPVSVARFSHTNSITIVLSHSNATTLSRFFYLGFRGTALVLKTEPGERLNIGAANSADRPVDGLKEKRGASQGLAGGSSSSTNNSPSYIVTDRDAANRIARLAQSAQSTPRRSPRRNPTRTPVQSPNVTPTKRRRTRSSSHAGQQEQDDTQSTPRPTTSPAKAHTPANPAGPSRTPHTAPVPRPRASLAAASASASVQPLSRNAESSSSTFPPSRMNDPTRRRSLSQPPPNEILMRQLTTASSSLTRSHPTTSTPARRTLANPFTSSSQAPQTPATDKRRKRNDALLASAQRSRRSASRKSLLWGGVGGWAGGREESPMDLLRRLARAPGWVAPSTPSEDSIAMPPPNARVARTSTASSTADEPHSRQARSSTASSTRSSLGSRRDTMLVPGESVPGDLTREDQDSSNITNTLNDDSVSHLDSPNERSRSRLSDMGIPRRASGAGLVRGGIFAAMADKPRTSRISSGSRVSFADQLSPSSMRFEDMSTSRREDELERSLQNRTYDFVSASGIDLATARAIRRLDDLTRQSFFSEDGQLQISDEVQISDEEAEEEQDGFGIEGRRKSHGRSTSEPLEGDADGSVVMFDGDDMDVQQQPLSEEEEEVSDALALDAPDDDSDGLARRLAATADAPSTFLDLSEPRDTSITAEGDDSRVSRVSFAEAEQVSFAPDDAYSSDEGTEYGLASAQDLDEEEEEEEGDSDAENRDASRLDLLDPKHLTSLLKRRIVKKRKSRVSPFTGAALPPLPASIIRDVFSSFLTPTSSSSCSGGSLLASSSSSSTGNSAKKAKLDAPTLDELDSAVHEFFADFSRNLLSQAKTRGKGGAAATMTTTSTTITEADVVGVLKRQGRVTPRHDASSLAHRLLPREVTDQMELSRWAKAGAVQMTLGGMLGVKQKSKGLVKRNKGDVSVGETTVATEVALDDETPEESSSMDSSR
ncbi:uncharacterized protein MEPE_06652 [Melanopsichium pennsylvanicum]|uniref:PITH domain-containing protein n=2 Tax=Melanopsichium pennsylvanicum TaxID=63383 RepID=A0AAJ4XTK1_9BASI|nr:conserved hypothetical protein [Melanopsichium pennsylvanicum 4]SNX87941.1 uncharacterized protein MEPE_06652 [Melanopsichium pennsylvanicum]